MIRCLASLLLPCTCLIAQGAAPAFVPKHTPMIRVQCNGMDELRQQWPQTQLGTLFADEDIQALVTKFTAWTDRVAERRALVFQTAARLNVELEPYEVRNLFVQPDPLGELPVPFSQMRRLEFYVTMIAGDDGPNSAAPNVETTSVLSCMPRYEGRWTQSFERGAAAMRSAPWSQEQEVAKVGTYDAYRFSIPAAVQEELGERAKGSGRWMLHLPGTFVIGSGVPEQVGSIDLSPDKRATGMLAEIRLDQYLMPFAAMGLLPEGLDLDALTLVRWSNRFVGEQIAEQFELVLADGAKPQGLLGAFFGGDQKLVPQALPKGAIAQVRFALQLDELVRAVETMVGGDLGVPEDLRKSLVAMLDGSISVGLCAPAPGGVIPRMFLTLGLADEDAYDGLLAKLGEMGLPTKVVKYGGVPCTLVKLQGVPGGIQPAFCRVNGRLHIAESGLSLRSFLKAQKGGAEAMDVGDASPPAVVGERIRSLETSFDLAQLYRTFYDVWQPLYELTASGERPVEREDMPDPDVVDEHVGALRGVAYRDGSRYVLRHQGAVGPVLAAYLMAWVPMGAGEMVDRNTRQLATHIAQYRLKTVWSAMQSFLDREGRLPKDLAELFVAEKLPEDALLLPMDDAAEEFVLPSGKRLRSSFRYYPKPVKVDRRRASALLIEILPRQHRRSFLSNDGQVTRMFGSESLRSIDSFGK